MYYRKDFDTYPEQYFNYEYNTDVEALDMYNAPIMPPGFGPNNRNNNRNDNRNNNRNDNRNSNRNDNRNNNPNNNWNNPNNNWNNQGGGPAGMPEHLGAPPNFVPQKSASLFRVDPGSIRNCMGRFTYIWMDNGNEFWMFPIQLGRNSVSGFRWNRRFGWTYFGVSLNRIDSFMCT